MKNFGLFPTPRRTAGKAEARQYTFSSYGYNRYEIEKWKVVNITSQTKYPIGGRIFVKWDGHAKAESEVKSE